MMGRCNPCQISGGVRITTVTEGWGGYAVDVDIRETDGHVRVVGRVDGALHWMFGWPTVHFRAVVPHDFGVTAQIDGGELLLEDLIGPISARVNGTDITLRRAEADVKLVSAGGRIFVEDVDGALRIESAGGDVVVSASATRTRTIPSVPAP